MQRAPISLVVITLNEGPNIERCLRSAPWVDDIVVLDSGSTDDTVARARKLGARVFIESFRGYREQKIRATALARHDWVLSLDGDEALSPELAGELQEKFVSKLLQNDGTADLADGFEMPRLSFHLGKWIRHGGWYPDWQLRLFHRARAKWTGGDVHEKVEGARVTRLSNPIQHWVFKDLADQVDTNNEYSTRGAKDLFAKGTRFSWFRLLFKPYSKFIETYIWKRGFLDGTEGLIISVGAAYSVFLKIAKLRELESGSRKAK